MSLFKWSLQGKHKFSQHKDSCISGGIGVWKTPLAVQQSSSSE